MTATTTPAPANQGIPLGRLVHAELRKLIDTRASFWLTLSIGAISAIVGLVILIVGTSHPENVVFGDIFSLMLLPLNIVLPVMTIMLVTSEWSQRNALTTFAMEPRRERVIAAKLVAVGLATAASLIAALVFAAIANLIGGVIYDAPAGSWSITAASLVDAIIMMAITVLLGFGLATLLLNTPAAIVVYFIVPTVLSLISEVIPWFHDNLAEWIDINIAQSPLQQDDWPTGGEWIRLIVASAIWIGLPLFFGIRRIMRAEIK